LKAVAVEDAVLSSGLAWPVGDFYVPGFSSDGRTGWVPGAPDTHRRLFLIRAAELQPELLPRCATCRSTTKRPCLRGQRAGTWPIHGASCWRTRPYVGGLLIPRLGAGNLRLGGFFRDSSHSRLSRYSLDPSTTIQHGGDGATSGKMFLNRSVKLLMLTAIR
jgi:hypothetical protein